MHTEFYPPDTSSSGAALFEWRAVGFCLKACVGLISLAEAVGVEIFLGFFERRNVRAFVMEIKTSES